MRLKYQTTNITMLAIAAPQTVTPLTAWTVCDLNKLLTPLTITCTAITNIMTPLINVNKSCKRNRINRLRRSASQPSKAVTLLWCGWWLWMPPQIPSDNNPDETIPTKLLNASACKDCEWPIIASTSSITNRLKYAIALPNRCHNAPCIRLIWSASISCQPSNTGCWLFDWLIVIAPS